MMLVSLDHYLSKLAAAKLRLENNVEAFGKTPISQLAEKEMSGEFSRIGSTAIIAVSGPIFYSYDLWTWMLEGCTYQGIINKTKHAMSDSTVTRIVYVFDTPGGEITGCDMAADAMFAARALKPCIAQINPLCASAGYWLASQCARISMISSGSVGSVGTTITYTSMAKYYSDMGIDVNVIRSSQSPKKNDAHPLEPLKQSAAADLQDKCDFWAEKFIAAVARGRGIPKDAVSATFGQGAMLYAEHALQAKMIDQIGTLDDVLAETPQPSSTITKRSAAIKTAASTIKKLV